MKTSFGPIFRSRFSGQGPIGFAAAANLIQRNLTPVMLEARALVAPHMN